MTKKTFVLTPILLMYGILNYFFVAQVIAELSYHSSMSSAKNLDLDKSLEEANFAIKLNSKEPRYFYNKAKILLLRDAPKETILENLELAQNINPNNLVTLKNEVPYYYFLSVIDISTSEKNSANFDQIYLTSAKSFLANLKNKYSNDVGIMVYAAKYEKMLGLTKEYGDTIKKIAVLRPDLLKWHPDLITQ